MTYYYIVAAIDNNGTTENTDDHSVSPATADDDMSDWSSPAMGMTDAEKPTEKPRSLMAAPRGQDRIWVSWAEVTGATEYVLQYRATGSSTWRNIATEPGRMTHSHTGRSAGTKYHYQVAAKNSGGTGPFAGEMAATTWSRALSTPTGLTAVDATDTDGPKVKLTWNKVNNAVGYEIQKWNTASSMWEPLDLDPDDGASTSTSMTSYTDMHGTPSDNVVVAGTTYHYIARAVSGDVTSEWTSDESGMTEPTMPDTGPTLHLDPTGQTMVRLTWTAVTGAIAYELQYVKGVATTDNLNDDRFDKMSVTLAAMPMHHTQDNLERGTLYTFRIRATLPLGVMSPWSSLTTPQQIITRPATQALRATSASSTSIKLTWDIVNPPGFADTEALESTDYELQRRKTGESTWVAVTVNSADCAAGKCSVTDAPTGDGALKAGMRYFYRLRIATTPTGTVSGHPEIKSYWANANARTPSQ